MINITNQILMKNNNKTKWGNNPFFNEQPQLTHDQPLLTEATQTTNNLFYKTTQYG